MGKLTNYDAHGVNERRRRGYGIFILPVPFAPSEEEFGKLDCKITTDLVIPTLSRDDPLPYSSYPVIRRDVYVCGSLTGNGNREYLRKRLNEESVPIEARNDTLRLLYEYDEDDPTSAWITEPVVGLLLRIETYDLILRQRFPGEVLEDSLMAADLFVWETSEGEVVDQSPAAEEAVLALKQLTITAEADEVEECAVCLDEFAQGSEVIKMPCSHVFHRDCIFLWLDHRYFCPTCRFKLMSEYEFELQFHYTASYPTINYDY